MKAKYIIKNKALLSFLLLNCGLSLTLAPLHGLAVDQNQESRSQASLPAADEEDILDNDDNKVIHMPVYPDSYPKDYGQWVKDHQEKLGDLIERYQKDREDGKESSKESSSDQMDQVDDETESDSAEALLASKDPDQVNQDLLAMGDPLLTFNGTFPEDGKDLGYSPNSLTIQGFTIPFEDQAGNSGKGEDFEKLMTLLDQNLAVRVGQDHIQTFFGHYYNLSDNGVFNPMDDMGLMDVGVEVVVTDDQGKSRGYQVTQTMEFLHPDQIYQYYGDFYMPSLAYKGNGSDMIYIQYCRWDQALGLLKTYIGYRLW